MNSFICEFSQLLESLASLPSELLIFGDFNIHVDDLNNEDANKFSILLENFNFVQHVDFPTHKMGHTLDLFITHKNTSINPKVEYEYLCFSDHMAIIAEVTVPIMKRPQPIYREYRKYASINIDNFKYDLQCSAIVKNINTTNDCNSYTELFTKTLSDIVNKHAPLRRSKVQNRQAKPFIRIITPEIKAQKSVRSRLETVWRNTRQAVDKIAFQTQAKRVAKLITASKRAYYRDLVNNLQSKPRNLWSVLNKILNKSTNSTLPTFTDLKDITTAFSQFFHDKIATLCSRLPPVNVLHDVAPPLPPPILDTFSPATISEIRKIIISSSNSSCLLDVIPTALLKSCIDILAEPITKMVNISLLEGAFPHSFKNASVRPLLKKFNLPKEELNNYRPISNLSFLSKILERIIFDRMTKHIQSFNTYTPFQSAYRKFHSTETALLRIQNDLLLAIDKRKVSALVLLDLSAAFDTIDHSILLGRLKSWFGISGSALELLSSYLKDRSESVTIQSTSSSPLPVLTGVPQGSVLGPLLFSLYTTPISYIISEDNIPFHLYADDTQLYLSFGTNELQANLDRLSSTLDKVHLWFTTNRLTLNTSKTEFLIIGNRQQRSKLSPQSLLVNGSNIPESKSARNLGVIFEPDLQYNKQISKICQISHLNIKQLRQVRSTLDRKTCILLANALVSSQLDYCNSLYYDLPKSSIHRLQVVQNSLARAIVPNVRRFDHIQPILKQLHWLPVQQRIIYKVATITYKVLNENQPSYLHNLLSFRRSTRNLRSSGKHQLDIPNIFTSSGRRAFSYCAPFVWNNLPDSIRTAPSLLTFRALLKTHLFPP